MKQHPITESWLQMMHASHKTITDENQSIKTRRFALLILQALDDAAARYGNDFKSDQMQAELDAYTHSMAGLPDFEAVMQYISEAA